MADTFLQVTGFDPLVISEPQGPPGPQGQPGIPGPQGPPGDVSLDDTGHVPVAQVPDLSGTYAPLAQANTFTQPQTVTYGGALSRVASMVGSGAARGAPTGTITAAANGAGSVTSTAPGRVYAYTELDGQGETPLSPASAALSLSAQRAKLTVPAIRPGMTDRVIYASDDSGVTWHKLGMFNTSGHDYFGSIYLDNTAAPLSGAAAPTTDSTAHAELTVQNDGMIYLRRSDNVSDVSDLTVLMANPANNGSLSIDCYGQALFRGGGPGATNSVTAQQCGLSGASAYQAQYVPDDGAGSAPVQTWRIDPYGKQTITGYGGDLGGPALSIAPTGAQTAATGGLLNITVPAGSTNAAMRIAQSGTGDVFSTTDNKFRITAGGQLNLTGSGSAWNYIPALQVSTALVAPVTTAPPPTLNTNGQIAIDNAGTLWFRDATGTRYKLVGTAA